MQLTGRYQANADPASPPTATHGDGPERSGTGSGPPRPSARPEHGEPTAVAVRRGAVPLALAARVHGAGAAMDGPLGRHHRGAAWADWPFMIGLLGIGIALMLGIAMRARPARYHQFVGTHSLET